MTGLSPRARRVAQILLVVPGLIASLAVAETALRVVPGKPHRYMMADPVLHHRLRPMARGRVHGVDLITNSMGFHDREITRDKPPGLFRILMLGDSFTEGGGLALEDTVAKQTERLLNTEPCRGRYEVVNGGVASYSPILEYLFLRHVGLALSPDLVVLNFDMTDVHDDLVRTAVATLDADGLPIAVPPHRRREAMVLTPGVGSVERWLFASELYYRLRTSDLGQWALGSVTLTPERLSALGLVGAVRYDVEAITRDDEHPSWPAAWRLTERYLEGTAALARAHHLQFLLVIYPHAQQVSATESPVGRRRHGLGPGLYASERPFRILRALGEREGFPVVDLLQLFRERESTRGPLFWRDDIHHTPAGARVFAEGIVAGARDARALPCLPADAVARVDHPGPAR